MLTTGIKIGNFSSHQKVIEILHNAKKIIETYGYISLADMLDLCGKDTIYKDTKIGWTESAFKNAKIQIVYEGYAIQMPEYNWRENDGLDTVDEELHFEPVPINITIPVDKSEAIEQIITALFNNFEKIKDHPVFINIV